MKSRQTFRYKGFNVEIILLENISRSTGEKYYIWKATNGRGDEIQESEGEKLNKYPPNIKQFIKKQITMFRKNPTGYRQRNSGSFDIDVSEKTENEFRKASFPGHSPSTSFFSSDSGI